MLIALFGFQLATTAASTAVAIVIDRKARSVTGLVFATMAASALAAALLFLVARLATGFFFLFVMLSRSRLSRRNRGRRRGSSLRNSRFCRMPPGPGC